MFNDSPQISGTLETLQLRCIVNPDQCLKCGKKAATGRKLRACKGCHRARYCDPACQKAHWGEHKILCRSRNQPKPERFFGFTPLEQLGMLQPWAYSHRWAIERIARTTMHLSGGLQGFLRRPQAFMVDVESNEELVKEMRSQGRLESASFFRIVRTEFVAVEPQDAASLRGAAQHLLQTGDKNAPAKRGGGAEPLALLPILYQAKEAGCIPSHHYLYAFRDERTPDKKTRVMLEDFRAFCVAMVNIGQRMDPLNPGDPVAVPHFGERGTANDRPMFRSWKDPDVRGESRMPGRTGMDAEELMLAYHALE